MSVLFRALNKAAKDNQRSKAPVFVPTLFLQEAPVNLMPKAWLMAAFALAVLLFGFANDGGRSGIVAPSSVAPKVDNAPSLSPPFSSDGITLGEVVEEVADPPVLAFDQRKEPLLQDEVVNEKTPSLSLHVRAAQAVSQKKWDDALLLFGSILKDSPTDEQALLGKTVALSQRGRKGDLKALEDMSEAMPNMAEIHSARAEIYAKNKDWPQAISAWRMAHSLDPDNETYVRALAVLEDKLGNKKEAKELYESLAEPRTVDVQKRLDYLSSLPPAD